MIEHFYPSLSIQSVNNDRYWFNIFDYDVDFCVKQVKKKNQQYSGFVSLSFVPSGGSKDFLLSNQLYKAESTCSRFCWFSWSDHVCSCETLQMHFINFSFFFYCPFVWIPKSWNVWSSSCSCKALIVQWIKWTLVQCVETEIYVLN